MPNVVFILNDGRRRHVKARAGTSLMEAGLRSMIEGIDAKCRGNCVCVTCHVHVAPEWWAITGAPSPMEEFMLDFADGVDEGSRLACQVRLTEACDGLEVRVPARQRTLGL